jgi:hypothetical protein
VNFQTIHSTVKANMTAAGFKYWEPQDWYDLEIGKLPEAALQDGFTLRYVGQDPSEHGTDDMGRVTMEVEFALATMRDAYLSKMGTCQTAIRALRGDLAAAGVTTIDDSIWPQFQMQYLGEILAMTFTIFFEVDSN